MLTTMLSRIAVGIARSHFFPFVGPANVPTLCPVSSRLMDAFFLLASCLAWLSALIPSLTAFKLKTAKTYPGFRGSKVWGVG